MNMTKEMKAHTADKAEFIKQKFQEEVERLYNSGGVGDNTKLVFVWCVALENIAKVYQPLFPTAKEKKDMKNLKCF
jgi:hypothetical protein